MDLTGPGGSDAGSRQGEHPSASAGPSVSIVVLAAGLSTRFGRNKLFEPLGGTTLIERVVSESLLSRATQVIVVGGHEFERLRLRLQGYGCETVYNDEYKAGQSSSVKRGMSKVSGSADAAMVLPGDMALTERSVIDAVIDRYSRDRTPIVSAGYSGRPGHPILFDRSLFAELAEIDEQGRGLKAVVARHSGETAVVETSPAALFDLDTPGDLARLDALSPGGNEERAGAPRVDSEA